MGFYKIVFKSSIERDFKKNDKNIIPKIFKAIEILTENPFPVQAKKLKDSESSHRLRVGNYRIIYQVSHENKIIP